jgi:flagellin-like protein
MKGILETIGLIILIMFIIIMVKWCKAPTGQGLHKTIDILWDGKSEASHE